MKQQHLHLLVLSWVKVHLTKEVKMGLEYHNFTMPWPHGWVERPELATPYLL